MKHSYKLIFLLFTSIIFSNKFFGQNPQTIWAKNHGPNANEPKKITTDKLGNVYSLSFSNSLTIKKYNAVGQLKWTKDILTGNALYSSNKASVQIDNNGDVIIAGTFSVNADFDPGAGVTNLTSLGYEDIFVEKIDSLGNFQWVKQIGDVGHDLCYDMKIDKLGNIIFTGTVDGTIDFNPNSGVFNSIGNNNDMYICKFSNIGSFVQVERLGQQTSNKLINPNSLVIDNTENIIIAGVYASFQDSIDFNPSINNFYLKPLSNTEIFILKLDKNINFKWAKRIGSPNPNSSSNKAASIKTDASNNIYFTGEFSGIMDVDPSVNIFNLTSSGIMDMFIVKLNSNGTFLMGKRIGGTGFTTSADIAIDSSSNIFLIGNFESTVDFDPSPSISNLVALFSYDVFILKLNSIGDFIWTKGLRGSSQDEGKSITVDLENRIYVSGSFGGGNLFFDNLVSLNASQNPDVFVAKIGDVNNILGNTFYDTNGNGVKDINDFSLSGIMVKASSFTKTFYTISDSLGKYNLLVDTGNFNISIPQLPLYYSSNVPLNHTANFGVLIGQIDTLNNFGLVPLLNKNDLEIKLTNISAARPGFKTIYRLTYKNVGTTTISGTVSLQHATQLSFISSSIIPISYNNPILNWSFSNLSPLNSSSIDVTFSVPSNSILGSNLKSIGTINPINFDETQNNNRDTLTQIITGSFDPNYKSVNPDGNITPAFIASGEYLDYVIRFQNIGTDTAINVTINDTLNSNLDLQSFSMLSSSHNYSLLLKSSGILEWKFNNIFLPDSNHNELASHGFIRYKIKPKNNLVLGSQIINKANIGFDFNDYIRTNETLNTVALFSDTLQTPIIKNILPIICSNKITNIGKLLNPPLSGTTITITKDGNPTNIPFNSTDSSFVYDIGSSGNHFIRVVYSKNSVSKQKDSSYVSTAPISATMTITAPTLVNHGSVVSINAILNGIIDTYNITWKKNGIVIGTTTAPSITYIKNYGIDTISANISLSLNGCYTLYNIQSNNQIVKSDDSLVTTNQIIFYPTPFKDKLNILNVISGKEYSLQISDLYGRIIGSYKVNTNNRIINLGFLNSSMYFIKVFDTTNNQQIGQTTKVIKIE